MGSVAILSMAASAQTSPPAPPASSIIPASTLDGLPHKDITNGIVSATIFLAWFAFIKGVPEANKELVYMALGSLITMSGTVLNFHRGSSQGSKDKALDLQNMKDKK